MAVVTVYPRHSKKCPKSKEKNAGQYKRCNCPKWLRWGKNGKKSAKTRSWEVANKAARKLEEELDLLANGIEPPMRADHITIESAADLYLNDMAQRGIEDRSKARRMLARLRDHANGQNVILLKDVTARLLTEWRSGWTFKKGSDSPAVHWSVVKTFFKWAFSTDLIPADPSAKLKSLPSGRHQVLPLSRDDFDRILAAVDQCGFTPAVEYRVKTFILLQRWSGRLLDLEQCAKRVATNGDSQVVTKNADLLYLIKAVKILCRVKKSRGVNEAGHWFNENLTYMPPTMAELEADLAADQPKPTDPQFLDDCKDIHTTEGKAMGRKGEAGKAHFLERGTILENQSDVRGMELPDGSFLGKELPGGRFVRNDESDVADFQPPTNSCPHCGGTGRLAA